MPKNLLKRIQHFNFTTMIKPIRLFLFILVWVALPEITKAKIDSTWRTSPSVNLNGFIDVFYAYDFPAPAASFRQPYLFNHNRHNEVNINMALIKLAVTHPKYRANIALHAGTYTTDNYAAEPRWIQNIFEANAGIALDEKNKLWLDGGIFGSHIGFEGAVSTDNWTLTRSLLAENSPYFLAGAKLNYRHNPQLEMALIVCNGWQRIQPVSGNSIPALGTQLKYTPNANLTFNWSTFIGTDDPDSTRRWQFFNNLYAQLNLGKKLGVIAGFDVGMQQRRKGSKEQEVWYSPVVIVRYAVKESLALALRGEYYSDAQHIIIGAVNGEPFKTSGVSLNVDYRPVDLVTCRLEGKWLNSRAPIFRQGNGWVNNNFSVIASIALNITKQIK